MPITKNPFEYYRYYCASQRRVEQWVQDTERLLQSSQGPTSDSPTTQWRGFLEDPGLATPISLPCPLDEHESKAGRLAIVPEHVHDPPDHSRRLATVPEHVHVHDDSPDHHPQTTDIKHPEADHDTAGAAGDERGSRPPPPSNRTPKQPLDDDDDDDTTTPPLRPRATGSRRLTPSVEPPEPSSKHESKQSRHSTSKSRNSGSSSSRKRQRQPRKEVDDDIIIHHRSIFAFILPYGIIPFLFAMTTGSSAVSLAAASIMLAGYFCLDYTSTADKRHSRK